VDQIVQAELGVMNWYRRKRVMH